MDNEMIVNVVFKCESKVKLFKGRNKITLPYTQLHIFNVTSVCNIGEYLLIYECNDRWFTCWKCLVNDIGMIEIIRK